MFRLGVNTAQNVMGFIGAALAMTAVIYTLPIVAAPIALAGPAYTFTSIVGQLTALTLGFEGGKRLYESYKIGRIAKWRSGLTRSSKFKMPTPKQALTTKTAGPGFGQRIKNVFKKKAAPGAPSMDTALSLDSAPVINVPGLTQKPPKPSV